MLKKIITVTMVSGLMLMASVGVFADAPPQDVSSSDVPPQDMLYDPELGYEVDLDNSASDTLGCTYVEGLGYEVTIDSENLAREGSYDSGWKDFYGGKWRHGVNSKHVWSKYNHSKKTHKTTVKGAGGKYSYSGWVGKGKQAAASWEKAKTGNKAWADVK